jgi:hypothetical protein
MQATKNPHGAGFLGDSGANRNTRTYVNGARSRNRTGTGLPPRDFKSLASTDFAIRAVALLLHRCDGCDVTTRAEIYTAASFDATPKASQWLLFALDAR